MRPARIVLMMLMFWNAPIALSAPVQDNPERQIQEVLKKVQLTREQKVRVRQIRESSKSQMQALREEQEKNRRELNRLLDTHGDDETVRQAFLNLQNTKRELEKARFERMLSIRAVLSPEQKAAFQNLRQNSRTYSARESSDSRRE